MSKASILNSDAIKVVFFDLGSVLVNIHLDVFVSKISQATHTDPRLIFAWMEANRDFYQKFERGLIDTEEFFRKVNDQFDSNLDEQFFKEAYVKIFSLNDPVVEIARQISSARVISIISNTDELHFGYLMRAFPVLQMFQSPTTSFETHSLKPEKEIYLHALHTLNVHPERSLFIDDLAENVKGARAVGMQALLFEGAEKLTQQLTKYGILGG